MNGWYPWAAIAVMAPVTAAIRFLPFWLFRGGRPVPHWLERLGRVLPYAIMGMLVVYCCKGIGFAALGDWLPMVLACGVTGGLHLWKRHTLLSIIGGTVCYMVLIQLVF